MRGMPLVQACMSKGSYCSGEKADKSMNFNTVSELLMIWEWKVQNAEKKTVQSR